MLGLLPSAIVLAAASGPAPVAVEVIGDGCPSEEAFRAAAEERLPPRRDPARVLKVKLTPSERGFSGTVAVVDARDAAPIASRTVVGDRCEDVASAALLLVALGSAEDVEAPAEERPPQQLEAAHAIVPDATPAPEVRRSRFFHVAAVGAVAGGVGPVATGGGVRIGMHADGRGPFLPELRAGVDAFVDAPVEAAGATATRSLIAARVDACPLGLGSRRVTARLCAAAALGEVRVRGDGVVDPKDEGRLWAAVGALARVRAPIAGGFALEVAGGVLAPLYAHRFTFEPSTTVVALAPAPFAEGGLSWSIP